jgi:hypothetical protein
VTSQPQIIDHSTSAVTVGQTTPKTQLPVTEGKSFLGLYTLELKAVFILPYSVTLSVSHSVFVSVNWWLCLVTYMMKPNVNQIFIYMFLENKVLAFSTLFKSSFPTIHVLGYTYKLSNYDKNNIQIIS